jgi:hypothetical protein
MRSAIQLQYDGVRLAKVVPFAWLIAAILTRMTHTMAAAGVPLSQPRVQSLVLVAAFSGLLGVAGTVQVFTELRENGRPILAAGVAGVFLACAGATMAYGFYMYSG